MGKRAETVAANSCGSENNGLGSCEAHHVGGFTEEDRCGCTGEVGEDTRRKEGGVAAWGVCCEYAAGSFLL
jgi:hypothetical protein